MSDFGSRFALDGKVAVVTGGASGIGAGIATVLAEAGATVVIADRDEAATRQMIETLEATGHDVHSTHVDVTDEDLVIRACADVAARVGAPWILVNNAGVQDRELLLEATTAEWERTMGINARGPFLMTREIAKAMVAKGDGGRIVNIASNALRGQIVMGHAPYLASKGALVGLSHVSALELVEHGITVNTILPGGVRTPGAINKRGPAAAGPALRQPPLGACQPHDIGAAVLFFATPAAALITNQVLAVDGGFSLT